MSGKYWFNFIRLQRKYLTGDIIPLSWGAGDGWVWPEAGADPAAQEGGGLQAAGRAWHTHDRRRRGAQGYPVATSTMPKFQPL